MHWIPWQRGCWVATQRHPQSLWRDCRRRRSSSQRYAGRHEERVSKSWRDSKTCQRQWRLSLNLEGCRIGRCWTNGGTEQSEEQPPQYILDGEHTICCENAQTTHQAFHLAFLMRNAVGIAALVKFISDELDGKLLAKKNN